MSNKHYPLKIMETINQNDHRCQSERRNRVLMELGKGCLTFEVQNTGQVQSHEKGAGAGVTEWEGGSRERAFALAKV